MLLLKSFTGSERLGRPFQYNLVLASEDHDLDYKKIIGQNVTVLVEKDKKGPRYFNGFVSRFAQTKYEQNLAEYQATLVPWLWFMTRSSDCRIFQNLAVPDILKQVFQDFGFSDIVSRLQGGYRKWSYCVQYRETAFDFVSRLMEDEGIYYYFKHEQGKHSIVLCDSPASHKAFEGYEELLYRPPAAGVVETLNSWVVQHEVQSGAFVTKSFDFTNPKTNFMANSFKDRNHGHSQNEQFDYLGEQSPFDKYAAGNPTPNPLVENERYAKLRLQELQAQHETYAGEGDARGICTGIKFVLKGHPRAEFEMKYLITGADYHIQCNPFETMAQGGEDFKYNARMAAMRLDDQFRAPRLTPKPIVSGPQTATVVGPAGQKIYTDPTGYGMVKVQFHWDRLGTRDENSSCWVRVSQAWAGKNWGDMALPHIGDEVIVECLEGDPDRPIITGRVYNAINRPPMALPANQNKRVWEDDYGNQLVFDATPGDEHIRLYSPHHNSGITLGRSSCNFTESNLNTCTIGDVSAVYLGATIDTYAGTYTEVIGGAVAEVAVGGNYNATIGAQVNLTYGPQFAVTRGLKYECNEDDENKICKGDLVISAGKILNLVGGAGEDNPGTSIFRADDDTLELTVGNAQNVNPITYGTGIKVVNIVTALVPLLSAGLMAAMGAYVQSYNKGSGKDESGNQLTNADGSNYTPTDSDVSQASTSLDNQKKWAIAAGVVQGASLVAMLIAKEFFSKAVAQTVPISHPTDNDFTARLKLNNPDGEAKLEAKKTLYLWGASESLIKMDKDAIAVLHDSGNVGIQSGTYGITIKNSGEITITGANIKVKGALDVADGALTVQGAPVAMANKLDSALAALKAQDKQEMAARVGLTKALLAKRVLESADINKAMTS